MRCMLHVAFAVDPTDLPAYTRGSMFFFSFSYGSSLKGKVPKQEVIARSYCYVLESYLWLSAMC